MSGRIRIALALVVLAAAAAIGYQFFLTHNGQAAGTILVSGNIEATDAEVSFRIPGRVIQRLVDEGQPITADQLVARLDSADLRDELALRQAELEAAQAALKELQIGSRPEEKEEARATLQRATAALQEAQAGFRSQEVAAAQATSEAAQADLVRAKLDYQRAEQLMKEKSISAQDFDRARAAYQVAVQKARQAAEELQLRQEGTRKEKIKQVEAALAAAKARYDLVMAGPRKETIQQASARVQQAKAAVDLAQTRLGYAQVFSPLTGMVLSKNIEPGEYVAPGTPVVTVGDLVNVWLRAYINETDLGRIKLGQKTEVTTDSYPGKIYPGHIAFISSEAEFTPKNVQTQQQRVRLVYRIKIDVTSPDMELKPGMPADAKIILSP